MKAMSFGALAFVALLAPQQAWASAITLEIAYPGISPTAENEISTLTFSETGASFEHPVSNISPQLFLFTALGTHLSSLTLTVFDGTVSLGDVIFNDVVFTSVMSSGVNTEDVSFVFEPPSGGFYTIDYPGIAPTAENEISSFTFSNTNVSFEHPVSNISPQLFLFTVLGTHLSNVTFAQEGGAVDLASLVFDDVIFTSLTQSGVDPPQEDVSFDFRQLAIVSPSADGTPPVPVPEAGSWLLVISGVLVLVGKRFLVA